MKFILLINVKMPTKINGIFFSFISRMNVSNKSSERDLEDVKILKASTAQSRSFVLAHIHIILFSGKHQNLGLSL